MDKNKIIVLLNTKMVRHFEDFLKMIWNMVLDIGYTLTIQESKAFMIKIVRLEILK